MDLLGLYDELTGRDLLKRILVAVNRMEDHMSALSDSLAQLSTAVSEMRGTYESRISDLQAALDDERAQDVNDSQALADAQARTNEALAEVQAAADQVSQITQQISQVPSDDTGGGGDTPEPAPTPDPVQPPDAPTDDTGGGGGDTPAPAPAPDDPNAPLPTDDSGNTTV
jgi:uncharacterized phage infection (PIP) family protein YhgE